MMNQMNNGNIAYKTSSERLIDFEGDLEGFDVETSNTDVEYVLGLSKEQLDGLSVDDCATYEFLFTSYAYYLQKNSK